MNKPLTISGLPVLDAQGKPLTELDLLPEPANEPTPHRLVIIHDTDADGIAAAWCINRGFKDEYTEVILIPQRSGINIIPEGLLPTDDVFMVDRTYPWDTLVELYQQVFSVTVIDHHKSAPTALITARKKLLL